MSEFWVGIGVGILIGWCLMSLTTLLVCFPNGVER